MNNFQNTPNDILLNEIFPKMTINVLMRLRQTDKRFRELVSQYLKITEDPTTILSIYNRTDSFYTKQNSYEIMMYFEKEYKFDRRHDHTDYMSYWFSKEIVCVIWFTDQMNDQNDIQFIYFDSNVSKEEFSSKPSEKIGKWRFLNSRPNVLINCLPEYIFHNYYINVNEPEDEEDDEQEFDICVDIFYKGKLLKSIGDEFSQNDYGYQDSHTERKNELVIKKYTKFFIKCFHLMNCMDVE
jgi:hypothetical protein